MKGAVLRQLPGTIRSGISDRRVTQYTVCVVEFRTLIHLDHSFFEIRAWLLGLSTYIACLHIPGQKIIKLILQCVSLSLAVFLASAPSAYYRLQRIQHEKEQRDLRRPSRDYVLYD